VNYPNIANTSRKSFPSLYTGTSIYNAPSPDFMMALYKQKEVEIEDTIFYENEYVVIKHQDSQSALARHNQGKLRLLDLKKLDKMTAIKPRNKEQYFAMDALMDDSIRVVSLTGKAGTGKTLETLAAAIAKIEQSKYKKLILTKPSSQVGRRELGILPGDIKDKYLPFLINFMCNLELLFGETLQNPTSKINVEYIFSKYNVEIVPLQLLRGASFNDALVIADEVQVLNHHEMLTLGTRISEGSKLVLMGDLNQRDEKIAKERTGLFNFINNSEVKNSNFTASVHLTKSERGEVSALFSSVFEPNE
jgi:PhoH-like ATPase